jgi:hypothetical protein
MASIKETRDEIKPQATATKEVKPDAVGALISIRERVYDLPNGHRNSAEHMYRCLQHEGFSPELDNGERDGEYRYGITIPVHEVPQLRLLQKTNPALWGNHPDVAQRLTTRGNRHDNAQG